MDEVDAEGKIVNALFTVEISMVEVAAAIAIIHRMGRIGRKLRDATFDKYMKGMTNRYYLLPVTPSLLHQAAHLTQKHPLKGYDAIQLAAGLELSASLGKRKVAMVFVSGDEQLLSAAQAEGLTADNPFNHV